MPITGYFYRQFTKLALECLAALAVASVAKRISDRFVLAMTKVCFHLRFQRTFDQNLGQLLEQAMFTYQVFGFFIARQQAVYQVFG